MKGTSLSVKGVTKRFGKLTAVKDLNLEVKEGELFGLLGPNGAGKSTLTKMLSGVLNPTSGEIKIGGYNIQDDPMKVKELLGVVPQDIVLYDYMDARENLYFFGRLYGLSGNRLKSRVREVLGFTQLREEEITRHISTYSGGMKRRVNVAVSLLHNPQVLLMDEPTAGLDPKNKHELWDIIRNFHEQGRTIILTTHLMNEAEELCTKVAIIDRGEVIAEGSPRQLIKKVKIENTIDVVPNKVTPKLIENLEKVPEVKRAYKFYDKEEDTELIKIITEQAEDILPEVVSKISEAGIKILSVELSQATLEDVFILLTGRSLIEEDKK